LTRVAQKLTNRVLREGYDTEHEKLRGNVVLDIMAISDHFLISVDIEQSQIEVHLMGFLNSTVVSEFYEAYLDAKTKVLAANDSFMVLFDLSELRVQSLDIVSDFALLLDNQPVDAIRIAYVTGDSPAVMQLRRIAANAHIFKTRAEARKWLQSPL
jgi:hypothetical protein